MKVNTILDQIDMGAMALPEFQRGYVWNRNQVRDLMTSLYRRHPVGGLLVWVTKAKSANNPGEYGLAPVPVKLILDGQQRVTSLYGIIHGAPPPFFYGNATAFTGLFFNLDSEVFEFYGPVKMQDNPFWIDVTKLMQLGLDPFITHIHDSQALNHAMGTYVSRLNAILGIRDIDLHIDEVTGQDKTVDVVVDIFNKVNSGGTKLSKGDLALARVCAEWPDARRVLRQNLKRWQQAGYSFKMDWLLRNVNTVITGEAMFSALKDVDAAQFQAGLRDTVAAVDHLLNVIASRLGLDHDRVLGGRYAFPVMTSYLSQRNGKFANARERDHMLYWYVHSFLWGRFAGATETTLNRDLGAMEEASDPIGALIEELRLSRGSLTVRPEDFASWGQGARFYPMLYLLTRAGGAQDWGSGLPITAHMLGKLSRLEMHHIFPKALLYKYGFSRAQVNALANFCFQPQGTNLDISDSTPEKYFEQKNREFPGALASQWVPMDRSLWRVDHYLEFLEARQTLLAQAANQFLDSLLAGTASETVSPSTQQLQTEIATVVRGGLNGDDEEEQLLNCNLWIVEQGLPEGELLHEATDEISGEPLVVIDLAWPNGLQEGLSQPVAVLIDEESETEEIVNGLGYRFFTNIDEFKSYVLQDILALGPSILAGLGDTDVAAVSGEAVRRMLTRRSVPPGQMALYKALYETGDAGLTSSELATRTRRSAQELSGVLGALGLRINRTAGLENKGGITAVFDIVSSADGEYLYRLRPVLREALEAERIV